MATQILGKVMITNKGEYSSSNSYNILDVVSYKGSSYISKINNNGSTPPNDNWQLLAQKGDTYEVTEEDLKAIEEEIVKNANSKFNENVNEKTTSFNNNAETRTQAFNRNNNTKLTEFNSNATEKTETFNSNASNKTTSFDTNATSKLNNYNTNATNKVEEYNQNARDKKSDFDTNYEEKITTFDDNAERRNQELDEHAEDIIGIAIDTRNELNRIKDDILETGEASDTNIHVEDSTWAELQELGIDGVCKQETTTGKNLLDINESTDSIIKHKLPKLLPAGTYIFSCPDSNKSMGFRLSKSEDTTTDSSVISGLYKSGNRQYLKLTISFDANYVNISGIDNTKEMMIESGTEPTEYEPYTNGISPNPEYPQEIKTIENNLNFTIAPLTFFDKNRFNYSEGYYNTDLNYTYSELTGTTKNKYRVENGHSYFISGYKYEEIQYPYSDISAVYFFDKNYKIISRTESLHGLSEYTFKVPKNCFYVEFQIGINKTNNLRNFLTSLDTFIFKDLDAPEPINLSINIPEGEFIGKIDDTYKDTLSVKYNDEDGQYHLVLTKYINKLVLTGDEEWISTTAATNFYRYMLKIHSSGLITNKPIGMEAMNTHFKTRILESHGEYEYLYVQASTKIEEGGVLYIQSDKWDSVEKFKEFLNENNVTIFYRIVTPYQVDLGVIDMPLSYNNVTNIFTDSDLLPNINAKYYRDFTKTVQNLQVNEKALKQELIDINDRLSALETSLISTTSEEVENDIQK